jgi:hypothetical protein
MAVRAIPEENQRVWIHGYEFYARHIRIVDVDGKPTLRFEGHYTENAVNDPLRHTGYDGGIYGHVVGYRVYVA